MHVTALSPVGAFVTGIRIDALSESQVSDVEGLLAEHGVVVMPNSDGGDEAFFQAIRNRVATNATGNLVVPHSVTDPFAAPLAGLI